MLTVIAVYLSINYLMPGEHLNGLQREFWFEGMLAWDGGWYMNIAENGYTSIQSTAFFPLYPMLIAAVVYLTGSSAGVAAVLISNLTFLAALYFLYKFIAAIWDDSVADRSILLAVLFPGTLFFTMAYTEAMTVLLTAIFFWMLHQGKWYGCIITAFLAVALKQTGLVLGMVLLINIWQNREMLSDRQLMCRFLSLGFIPIGLFGFMLHTYMKFGDPFAFFHAQSYWGREPVIPIVNILYSLANLLFMRYKMDYTVMVVVNGFTTLLSIYMVYLFIFKVKVEKYKIELSLYLILTLLLTIISAPGGGTEAYGRHMSTLFPVYPMLAICYQKKWRYAIAGTGLYMSKFVLICMFSNGYWVT